MGGEPGELTTTIARLVGSRLDHVGVALGSDWGGLVGRVPASSLSRVWVIAGEEVDSVGFVRKQSGLCGEEDCAGIG